MADMENVVKHMHGKREKTSNYCNKLTVFVTCEVKLQIKTLHIFAPKYCLSSLREYKFNKNDMDFYFMGFYGTSASTRKIIYSVWMYVNKIVLN